MSMLKANSSVLRGRWGLGYRDWGLGSRDKDSSPQSPILNPHAWEVEQLLSHLQSHREGLTYAVARQRLRRYGRNQLPQQHRIVQIVMPLLTNPCTYLVLAIAAWMQYANADGWYVLGVVIFNTCIGMGLTAKAIHTKKMTLRLQAGWADEPQMVKVRRDSESILIPSRDLVVGDIVEIHAGDQPDIDLRLFEAVDLKADQSSIVASNDRVGKALTVQKQGQTTFPASMPALECSNIIYAGTIVIAGRGCGIVVATGKHVYRQRRVRRDQSVAVTPDELRHLLRIWCIGITAAIALLIVIFIARGGSNWYAISVLCVALGIGIYPHNLLWMATLMQLLGVQELAHKSLWLKFPSAIDTLSRISVIVPILDSDMTVNIENLDGAGVKWHGLTRAAQSDADTLCKVLEIEVSSYSDRSLEMIQTRQMGDRLGDRVSHGAVAVVANTSDDLQLLQQADIGICARTAPKVLQNCAELILPEVYFQHIPIAIVAGRGVFERLQHIVWQLITSTGSLVVLTLMAVYIKAAIVPLQIIWSSVIATPLLTLVFMCDPTPANIMTKHSKQFQSIWHGKYLHLVIAIATIVMTVMAVFWFKYQQSDLNMLPEARTMAFTTLVFSQIFYTCSLVRKHVFSNIYLIAIISFLAITQAAIIHLQVIGAFFATTPLSWTEWAIASLAATSIFWVEEILNAN
jgi:magnesium-transporting ATPase (P-type)